MNTALGKVIAENRKKQGMTQAELAEKLGVTDKAVSKWERDLSCPDIGSLPRLSEALGLSLDELMQGTEAVKKPDAGIRAIADLACKGVALAMGVAVLTLTALGALDTQSSVSMLALGLVGAALSLLRRDK